MKLAPITLAGFLVAASCQVGGPRVPVSDVPIVPGKPPEEQQADNKAAQATLEEYAKRFKEGYPLYPGDLLRFTVFGAPDASPEVRVPAEGFITYPLIGKVGLVGRTTNDVRQEIQKRLGQDFLVNPDVTCSVLEYSKKKFYVLGCVKTPMDYELPNGRMVTLQQAIAQAGGLLEDAESRQVRISRARAVGGNDRVTVTVDVSQLVKGATGDDPLVIPDDIITIPKRDKIYVLGQVQHPGQFMLPSDHATTVSQAISMAGGLTRISAEGSVRLIRRNKEGQRVAYVVDVARALAGHPEDDATCEPGDTLFVPESFF